jgi:hypothetical protein
VNTFSLDEDVPADHTKQTGGPYMTMENSHNIHAVREGTMTGFLHFTSGIQTNRFL